MDQKEDAQIEASTQTAEKTNINIISNIRLSQNTLNAILRQVMKDVVIPSKSVKAVGALEDSPVIKESKNLLGSIKENSQSETETTAKLPESKIEAKEDKTSAGNKIVKYTVGNVTSAKKREPNDTQNVYRDTHFNRTSSLEVNTSSPCDTEEGDSDSNSFIDSLEGSPVPKRVEGSKPIRGEMYFLNTTSSNKKKSPSAFFVPMENTNTDKIDAIADHFPSKLKEKLAMRQAQRDQSTEYKILGKDAIMLQAKKQSNVKINTKTVLPNIGFEEREKKAYDKATQCKPVYKNKPPMSGSNYKTYTKKTLDEKTVRILEIMECVEKTETTKRNRENMRRFTSRIPRLIKPYRLPKINVAQKPKKVDYTKIRTDPKYDKLVANILINTIQTDCLTNVQNVTVNTYKRPFSVPTIRPNQGFESIPENPCGCNKENQKDQQTQTSKSDALFSVPQGWISFYSTKNRKITSDSSSDEGVNASHV